MLRWVDGCIDRTGGHPERLHPLYTVDGLELGPEAVIDTLPGYAGSRPVRIGNAANRQIQLDVFGPDRRPRRGRRRGARARARLRLARRRGDGRGRRAPLARARSRHLGGPMPPRHHVYSKVMCWLTVDRAIEVQALRRRARPVRVGGIARPHRANVLEHGWNEAAGAYSVAYGDPGDRRLLPLDRPVGPPHRRRPALPGDGARGRGGAAQRPVVYRYRWDDGLPGPEGGFHICTAWLSRPTCAPAGAADAEELFEQMIDCAGPTGLLPEQYDPFDRARPRQPPAGLQPPRADPLRAGSRGRRGRYVVRRRTTFRRKQHSVVRRRTTESTWEWGVPQRPFPVERCGTPHSCDGSPLADGRQADDSSCGSWISSSGRGRHAVLAAALLVGPFVAVALDLPLQLVEQLVDSGLVGRRRLACDEVGPLCVDDCIDHVVVRDRGVALARKGDLTSVRSCRRRSSFDSFASA